MEPEDEQQRNNMADFKPRRNYELPYTPKPAAGTVQPNESRLNDPVAKNLQNQQANEYLLSRVQDPKYQ